MPNDQALIPKGFQAEQAVLGETLEGCSRVYEVLTKLSSLLKGKVGQTVRGCAMKCLLPHAKISSSSRRRLARWLVGSSLKTVERDIILETLAHTCGNRTVAARLLGVSARTLRNKIAQYSLEHRTTSNTGGSPTSIGTSPQREGWRRGHVPP